VNKSLFSEEFLKKLDRLVYLSKKIPSGTSQGIQKTYRKGSSLEFHDYRTYNRGDDIKSIDWNVWERLGQLVLKIYSADLNRNVSIIIDTSESMGTGFHDKLTFSLKTAAALGYIGMKNQDRVSVISINETVVDYMKPSQGKGNIISLYNFLSTLKASGKTDLSGALKNFASRSPANSIVIILSDLLDYKGLKEGLYHLVYNKLDVVIIHILSDEDLLPDFSGPVRLRDSETGSVIDLTFNKEILKEYKIGLDNYLHKTEKLCLKKNIEYIRVASSTPFEDLILKYMRQRHGMLLGGSS
jgi:uncharacterized protein (DUF58 family)